MNIGDTKVGMSQIGRPAPLWWRKAKKVFVNTENLVLTFLAFSHPADSFVMLLIKAGSSWIIENIETILGNGQHYSPSDKTIEETK